MIQKIDYSQYSKFLFCPWAWHTNYIQGLQRTYTGQRSDPLALGSLVHEGMDYFSRTGKLAIPEAVVAEVNPSPETLTLAEVLISGYLRKYATERWKMEATEQAVEFPLTPNKQGWYSRWTGIAKLDKYFFVPEDTTIESGLPGTHLTLARGWWAKEYKTKSHGIERGVWMKEWASKRQADFQLLALTAQLRKESNDRTLTPCGVLVSVLEKPREYVPKRKCKGCGGQFDLASYQISSEGHVCPMCGNIQKLSPYTPTVPPIPEYFQMIVTRTPEQLEVARQEIGMVTEAMEQMIDDGMESVPPNRDNCISNRWHRPCEYAEEHIAGVEVGTPKFTKVDPYVYIGIGR